MAESNTLGKGRLEAFSDGVIAIIITIMVLELDIPEVLAREYDAEALGHFAPKFIAYAVSFLVIAIYWLNHHNLTHRLHVVPRRIFWENNLHLFCLSLVPMATKFLGANPFSPIANGIYGAVAGSCAITITMMRSTLCRLETDPEIIALHGMIVRKSIFGICVYLLSIPVAFASIYAAWLCFAIPPTMFFLPDVELKRWGR